MATAAVTAFGASGFAGEPEKSVEKPKVQNVELLKAKNIEKAEVTIKNIQLSTGRNLQYRVFGAKEGTPVIFVHGFMGSGEIFEIFNEPLAQSGVRAVAPDLYADGTSWNARQNARDAGVDIAELARKEFPNQTPRFVGSSGGSNITYAAIGAYNSQGKDKVEQALIASGTSHNAFAYLSAKDQSDLRALWGVPNQAILPIMQGVRNRFAGIKQNIAHKRLEALAGTDEAKQKISGKFSPPDWAAVQQNPKILDILSKNAASYSAGKIDHNLRMMFHSWDIPRNTLVGTEFLLVHGWDDTLVPRGNAEDALAWLKAQPGVSAKVEYLQGQGHLAIGSKEGVTHLASLGRAKNGNSAVATGTTKPGVTAVGGGGSTAANPPAALGK